MNRRIRRLVMYRYSGPSATWPLGDPACLSWGPQPGMAAGSPNGWPLGKPASPLSPETTEEGAGFPSGSGTIGRELLDEPAAAPVTVGDDAQQRVPSGPLDSDYGHGWAA